MTVRRLSLKSLAIAVLSAAVAAALATPANAAPDHGDYTRSIQMSWDGTKYADTTVESFLGSPVTVPGDTATRKLLVRNDGPTDATLRATIVNVNLKDPDAPDVHHNPTHVAPNSSGNYRGAGDQGNFYDDLMIDWDDGRASMTQLDDNGDTRILEIGLKQGEAVPITLGYDFPITSTSGNQANVAPRLAAFDVLLELGGEFGIANAETPGTAGASTAKAGAGQMLPATGAQYGLKWFVLAAALLLALGALLVRAARQRDRT